MHDIVTRVVQDSGLWSDGRHLSHRFLLSPDAYEISPAQQEDLRAIGTSIHDCLAGIGRIAAIAEHPHLGHGHVWRTVARVLRTGVPSVYHGLVALHPGQVPAICKVDLMESTDGRLLIAEIDGHNKHGLGYSTLGARLRHAVRPGAAAYPGVASAIAEEVRRRGEERLLFLYAEQERFYLPEFRIFRSALEAQGIACDIVEEKDARLLDDGLLAGPDARPHRLLMDFPFLFHRPELNQALCAGCMESTLDFLIPPKPFLGSKFVLALLRNDTDSSELEAILRSHIPIASLERIRQHIPFTLLLNRKTERGALNGRDGMRHVLKETISSGMKGTLFQEDETWAESLAHACGSRDRFVLQEEVTNRGRRFSHYDEAGVAHEGEWFMRITAHYARRCVADVIVTARRDKKVHGAKDCLQLGTVLT